MNSNLYLYYISWSSLFDRNCALKHFGILRLRAESSVIFVHDICSCFTTVIKSIAFWFYSLQVWVDTSLCKTFNFSVKWGKTIFTFPLNGERLFSQDSISVNFSPNFPTSLNASCCAGHRNYSVH